MRDKAVLTICLLDVRQSIVSGAKAVFDRAELWADELYACMLVRDAAEEVKLQLKLKLKVPRDVDRYHLDKQTQHSATKYPSIPTLLARELIIIHCDM